MCDGNMSFLSKTGNILGQCSNSYKTAQIRDYWLKLV